MCLLNPIVNPSNVTSDLVSFPRMISMSISEINEHSHEYRGAAIFHS